MPVRSHAQQNEIEARPAAGEVAHQLLLVDPRGLLDSGFEGGHGVNVTAGNWDVIEECFPDHPVVAVRVSRHDKTVVSYKYLGL